MPDTPIPALSAIQTIIRDTVDAGREDVRRQNWLAQQPPLDNVTQLALRVANNFRDKWTNGAENLLEQLPGTHKREDCLKLADLLRPARLYVSMVRMESTSQAPHPTSHTACFVHVTDPELLMANLHTVIVGKTLTLVETL